VRIGRLADELAPALQDRTVLVHVDQLHDLDEWRAAARKAGRDRRWQVRTGTCGGGTRAWATRTDREITPVDMEAVVRMVVHARPPLTLVDRA
jgi:hypothetical protein